MDAQVAARLESYLRDAVVLHVRPLPGGGGHASKAALILQGGVGVVAKRAADGNMLTQAKREVAAWVLAMELGLSTLVPTTVLRQVPETDDVTGGYVEASVQVLWPRFTTAAQDSLACAQCSDELSWSVAVFDILAANTDRNDGNWGTIEGLPRVALVDHGHAFQGDDSNSPFVERHRGEDIPPDLISCVEQLHANEAASRLTQFLDVPVCQGVFARAAKLKGGKLDVR
jgi:hypothetical protein